MKKDIEEQIDIDALCDDETNIDEFISSLEKVKKNHPNAKRIYVKEICNWSDGYEYKLTIVREETNKEYKERLDKEEKIAERKLQRKIKREKRARINEKKEITRLEEEIKKLNKQKQALEK